MPGTTVMLSAELAGAVFTQQPTPAKPLDCKPATVAAPTAKPADLPVEGVIAMIGVGLSDDLAIARLREENTPMELCPEDLIRLKKATVRDCVPNVMIDPALEPNPSRVRAHHLATVPDNRSAPLIAGLPVAHQSGAIPEST